MINPYPKINTRIKMHVMSNFSEQITARLNPDKGYTKYKLAKDSGVSESSVINIANGKLPPSDAVLDRFAKVEWLGMTLEELQAWRALDEYGPGILDMAKQLMEVHPLEDLQALYEQARQNREAKIERESKKKKK